MTTATGKTVKNRAKRKAEFPPLPPSAGTATLDGKDYVIIPADEYAEWCEDRILGALVEQRMREPHTIVPFSEIEKSLGMKKKKK